MLTRKHRWVISEILIAIATVLMGTLGIWLIMTGLDVSIKLFNCFIVSLGIYVVLFAFKENRGE